eukprot:5253079-Pleurochrysis_carterae.AAC.2
MTSCPLRLFFKYAEARCLRLNLVMSRLSRFLLRQANFDVLYVNVKVESASRVVARCVVSTPRAGKSILSATGTVHNTGAMMRADGFGSPTPVGLTTC